MRKALLLAPLALVGFLLVPLFSDEELPVGKYRKHASDERIAQWERQFRAKRGLVPPPPAPPPSDAPAVDFSGTYRFGPYDYDLEIQQRGDEVTFRSGGVDHQDIGGPFETVGAGTVEKGKIRARWWCIALHRNYANNGGCEMWFAGEGRDRIHVRYYHDADERIEEGYGVRLGTNEKLPLHYRIRMRHPVRTYKKGVVLKGTVRGRDGETIRDAVVMLRHEEASAVRTDGEGRFELRIKRLPTVQMISAAAPGYRTGVEAILKHELRKLHFVLEPSPWSDDPRYRFVAPERDMKKNLFQCANCHRNSYAEWKDSRHAVTATNAITRAVYERDFLPALAAGTAVGDAGLCAACHAPQAALDGRVARLDEVEGVALRGNHCDFCHKVHHTEEIDAPGVRGSLVLGRPSPDDDRVPGPIKRIYGALADSDYLFMGPVYNPFFATSALCAGCHQYTSPNGLPALDTYAEWQRWSAGEKEHRSCQTCHMPTGVSQEGSKLARRICVNALRRPQEQIHDHSFQGRDLVASAVELRATAARDGDAIDVTTTLATTGEVGHKVPTGSADKHLLLVVLATDDAGRPLALAAGPRLPAHAGGDADAFPADARALGRRRDAGDLAGFPGREFAQILADATGATHVPFWRAVRLVEDTRLEPGRPARVRHRFRAPEGVARVRVELWHRLRFKSHDVAAGVTGTGVRPLDHLVATVRPELR